MLLLLCLECEVEEAREWRPVIGDLLGPAPEDVYPFGVPFSSKRGRVNRVGVSGTASEKVVLLVLSPFRKDKIIARTSKTGIVSKKSKA